MKGKKRRPKRTQRAGPAGLPEVPHRYRGLELDAFQIDAAIGLQQLASVLVSAPTGTGKSLIADYLVDDSLASGKQVWYTAPIKALVNQKYRDFAQRLGGKRCGILTGDLSVNPGAQIVVMTTEVLRNMLTRGEAISADWVIFDEIHYLGNSERGTVWEECLLLLPKSVRILGQSATVPNIAEMAAWIRSVQGDEVYPVVHDERAVPLRHLYFTQRCEAVPHDEAWQTLAEAAWPHKDEFDLKGGTQRPADVWSDRPRTALGGASRHLDLVAYLGRERLFPAIYFTFSRRACESKAAELARTRRPLPADQKESIRMAVRRVLAGAGLQPADVPELNALQDQWDRGVGLHHAGLLPVVKQIVEHLLEQRILRIVYATETFAVGVNMPVRTVCFDSLEKFDGRGYRLLSADEYAQMAGRAGRRGLDREGTAIAQVDLSVLERMGPHPFGEIAPNPVQSRFDLSYTAILNWVARFSEDGVRSLLAASFAAWQGGDDVLTSLEQQFAARLATLEAMGYVLGRKLTPKGEFCRGVWVKELLVTEMVFDSGWTDLSASEAAGWAGALVWEPRPRHEALPGAAPFWVPNAQFAAERAARAGASADRPRYGGSIGTVKGVPALLL